MVWSLAGIAVALAVAAIAWRCSRSPGGFYDREVYGMNSRSHLSYAAVSVAFAAYFAVAAATGRTAAGIGGLALYAVVAVFYVTSFLQGAPDRDE
jgi:hypothetical protein